MATIEPKTRIWKRDEYYRIAEIGLLEGQRSELIEGEVLITRPPSPLRAAAMGLVSKALCNAFGNAFCIRSQLPLVINDYTEPEPDVAVVPGSPRDYSEHPTTATLIVEISDTSIDYDRTRKARLYAQAGIDDYWILNLNDRRLEIHRRPTGDSYADVRIFDESAKVSPLAVQTEIAVVDLLP